MADEAVSEAALTGIGEAALRDSDREQVARWLFSLDEDYYRLFGLPQFAVEALLHRLLRDPSSEFGTSTFFMRSDNLAGFVAAFPSEQTFARRMQVLKALLEASPDPTAAKLRLRGFDGAGRTLPLNSLYLSKLYLTPELRGSGLAGYLLEYFIDAAEGMGRCPCLHVRRDNRVALAFYRRHGFRGVDDADGSSANFLLMGLERQSQGVGRTVPDGTA